MPKVVALGVVDRAQNPLFCEGYVLANGFDEIFHILALRLVIHGAGIVHDRQILAFYGGFYVVFFQINEGANERYARFVHMSGGREARESALVKKG